MKYDITNNNVFPVKVLVYECRVKNPAVKILQMLQSDKPTGLGTSFDDRDADPWDAAWFSRYYSVERRHEHLLPAGKSWHYEYWQKGMGSYGTTFGKYKWFSGAAESTLTYTPGVQEPVLMKFVPMPQSGSGDPSQTGSDQQLYTAVMLSYEYSYHELEDNEPTLTYSTAARDAITQPLFNRAPGNLAAKATLPDNVVDRMPVYVLNAVGEEEEVS